MVIFADVPVAEPSTETAPSADVIGWPAATLVTWTGEPSLPAFTFADLLSDI